MTPAIRSTRPISARLSAIDPRTGASQAAFGAYDGMSAIAYPAQANAASLDSARSPFFRRTKRRPVGTASVRESPA